MKVRRSWAALVPAAALSIALAGCGSSTNGTGGTGATGAAPPPVSQNDINATDVSQVKDGGIFHWELSSMPPQWNPYELDGTLADTADVMNGLLPQSFDYDASAQPHMNADLLADAKLTSTNPTEVVTLKINPKAMWSDGTKITANDYVQMWKSLNGSNKAYKVSSTTGYDQIGDVKQGTDDHEVVMTFSKKFAAWQSLFDPLLPASLTSDPKAFNEGWLAKPLVTGGPFKLESINKTAKTITVARSNTWWGTPTKLDKIVFTVIDPDAQMQSLASGEQDMADIGPDATKNAQAKKIQGANIRYGPAPNFRHMTFNAESEVLKDANVRRALIMGLDRGKMAAAELGPLGVKAVPLNNHILMTNQDGYQDNTGDVKYSVDKAKQLLDQAGWTLPSGGTFRQKGGKELDVNFVIPSAVAASDKESKESAALWKEIGVKVNIQVVPVDDFFDKYITPGHFDVTVFSWIGGVDISSNKSIYQLPQGDDIKQNFARVGSAQIDTLFDQLNAEFDHQKQIQIANQIDGMIWQEAHSATLFQRPNLVAVKSTVANFGAFGFATTNYKIIGFKK